MAKKKKATAKKAVAKKKSGKKAVKKATKKAAKKAAKKPAKKSAGKATGKAKSGKKAPAKRSAPKKATGKGKASAQGAKKGAKGSAKKKNSAPTKASGRSGAARAAGAAVAGAAFGAMLSSKEGGSPSTEEESPRALPEIGSVAPEFSLIADDGSMVNLGGFKGRSKVILYFYPKDDTPGCTKEACDFSADWGAIQSAGAVVLGVSPDGVSSHAKFRDKYRISFRLLADEGAALAKRFGAWGEKNMYGRVTHGIIRSTFLIDEVGNIARVWPKVRVEGHSQDVLAAVRSL